MKKLLLTTLSFIGSLYSTQQRSFWTQEEDQKLIDLVSLYNGSPKWIEIAEKMPGRSRKQCRKRWAQSLDQNIKRGKWTDEENQLLIYFAANYDGPEYGKWSFIASQIPGRTAAQCRQKWNISLNPYIKDGSWTQEEDKLLTDLVSLYDSSPKWIEISGQIPGRTDLQCRQRWLTSLDPEIKRGSWTDEEERLLINLVSLHGDSNWSLISEQISGRTPKQCRSKWIESLDSKVNHCRWSIEEDQKLTDLVLLHGNSNWALVAEQIPGRTADQCREKWTNSLDPSIKRGDWTDEEERLLINLISLHGDHNWVEIAEQIPGRTNRQCRMKWSMSLGPDIKKGVWTDEEDELLIDLVNSYNGHPKWTEIAEQIPGRTNKQCRERWTNSLDSGISHSRWTPEEDELLIQKYKEFGSKWPKIKNFFNNRTDSQLRNRYSRLFKAGLITQNVRFIEKDLNNIFDIRNFLNNK